MLVPGNDLGRCDPRRREDNGICDPAFNLSIAQLACKPGNIEGYRDDRRPPCNIVSPDRYQAFIPLLVNLGDFGDGDAGDAKFFRAPVDDLNRFLIAPFPVLDPGPGINKIYDGNRLRYPG